MVTNDDTNASGGPLPTLHSTELALLASLDESAAFARGLLGLPEIAVATDMARHLADRWVGDGLAESSDGRLALGDVLTSVRAAFAGTGTVVRLVLGGAAGPDTAFTLVVGSGLRLLLVPASGGTYGLTFLPAGGTTGDVVCSTLSAAAEAHDDLVGFVRVDEVGDSRVCSLRCTADGVQLSVATSAGEGERTGSLESVLDDLKALVDAVPVTG